MTAVAYRRYFLICNHGACRNRFPGEFALASCPPSAVRAQAARSGWTHVSSPLGRSFGTDWCPQHAPEGA